MKILITLSILLSAASASAQDNYGYYGKKTYIDIQSNFHIPLIYNLSNGYIPNYELSPSGNSLLSTGKDWFNLGARVSINRAVKTNVGIGLEFGFDRITLGGYLMGDNNVSYYSRHESIKVNSFLFMPKLELSGSNGLLPNGIVHQIGVGLLLNKVSRKYYLHDDGYGTITGGPNADQSELDDYMADNKFDEGYKMMRLMYGLKMRTPVGKSLMINYGIRYTLDFGIIPLNTNYELNRAIRAYQFRNVISFDLGLTVPF